MSSYKTGYEPRREAQKDSSFRTVAYYGTLKLCADHILLNEQLQLFPNAQFDDGPDALAMGVCLAEEPKIVTAKILGDDRDGDWVNDYRRNFGWKI